MPSYLFPLNRASAPEQSSDAAQNEGDHTSHVDVTDEAEDVIAELHHTITGQSFNTSKEDHGGAFAGFEAYLRGDGQTGPQSIPLSVCFKSVTTYGQQQGTTFAKTVKDAIFRTLTLQDIYEWTLKRVISPVRAENGRALIRDFTGVVRSGEMMLVLGNPGSGCSTFLRTIGNDHSSFLGIKGSIDYSGLSPDDISRRCRGLVSYVPEDDVHLPTLTVRQTLEFALKTKTPRKSLHEIPLFLNEFGRVFGMAHVLDTLVGNEYIRGVSGGERKRVSILESLASGSSVNAWDGSTRGLDAASAADYIKSLRIMTDACQRATIVSLYQASDAIYDLMDKVMLIDEGRMIYQGPAGQAEAYFNSLGYQRLPRQTTSDFLTTIPLGNADIVRAGYESRVPRGAVDLEKAFRASQYFKDVQDDVLRYEEELQASAGQSGRKLSDSTEFKQFVEQGKSKYVSASSSYNTSFPRQVLLCARRELWQIRGDLAPFITRVACNVVSAFLLGSMFYKMPDDTDGVYSRGGFSFYSSVLVAWFQLAELENAFFDRTVVSRQKRYAAVRPSAVVAGKALIDIITVLPLSTTFSLIAYFLAGMKQDAGSFFSFMITVFLSAMSFTAFYRVFGAASRHLEVALRYCGVTLLISMICGGYVRSVDRLIADVPWVGWLAYITPVPYAFEILMATEFHGRDFTCALGSVIPSGPAYNDSAFQSCASTGVAPGEMVVNGDDYVRTEFGFSYDNVGRDFGILILFTVALLLINMWLVEKVDWVGGGGGALTFSRKTAEPQAPRVSDEETTDEAVVSSGVSTPKSPKSSNGLIRSRSTFTWRDLNYTVHNKDGEKQLLKGVSGYLMTVLTQQATGTLTGEMKIDGNDVDSSFGRGIGYCQQMDIHVEASTVREAFEFSALLRQSSSTSKSEKLAYVDEVLDILGMAELQHALIGSLSLEQKKRTTIGVELCAKPRLLLFLDEPTSGLDSQGAMSIVRLLRRLADGGQAIICTIHQANQEQFELFDRVLALDRGGRVYYFGDTGVNGGTVIDYFNRNDLPCDKGTNVADLLIEATARNSATAPKDWCDIWEQSPEAAAVLAKIDAVPSSPSPSTNPGLEQELLSQKYASSTIQQTVLLTKRTLIQYWRTPDYIYSRLYCSFCHAGLNGLAFLQLGNSVADMQYRLFACFMVLMIVPEFINACSMMFIENRNIWLGREHPSRIYGWTAFTTAQIMAEIPYAFAGCIIFYLLFYFLIGFPLGTPAGYTFLMMAMFHLFCTSWGQWIAALSASAVMAANIMPVLVLLCEFFNGVVQPRSLMPDIWAYTIYYIGPFTYWISGVVAMILPGLEVRCTESELIRFEAPRGLTCADYAGAWLQGAKGYLSNPNATGDCGYCQYSAGEDYMSKIALTSDKAWPYLGIFALFTVSNYLFVYFWVYIKSVRNLLPW
ncbi:probable ATP-binding multidrug cassette transport protein [Cephalotrichum gorgonifer]|uniref:Probable ATP-binding multidrug cassette transport protein n=1 Tax=Cephalotrichum gorgonifer TaxID=2041049 RepID=A0AAE8N7P3_9PEZI|nr:probable ATP-binding multidrug cassette transport protein [Cephalotrichum gorgonifer]